jgi:hypothetical protein
VTWRDVVVIFATNAAIVAAILVLAGWLMFLAGVSDMAQEGGL